MRRVLLSLLALTVLTGCATVPQPIVTFFAAGRTVTVPPTQYCSATAAVPENEQIACPATETTIDLRVPPGMPLQISVPNEASDGIWHVAMGYRTPDGERRAVGSRNFVAGTDSARSAFTLRLPTDRDQLELVQVRSIRENPSSPGSVTMGVWLLRVT